MCASGCLVTRVKWTEPDYVAPAHRGLFNAMRPLDHAECLYARAVEHEQKGFASCVDLFFEAALATCHHDRQSDQRCRKRELHKSALMKLVVAGQCFHRFDPQNGLQVMRDGRSEWIPISYHGFVWQAQDFHFLAPVGNYKTNAFKNSHRRSGIGVPLVVTRCGRSEGTFLPDRSDFAATLRMGCDDDAVGQRSDGTTTW